MSKNDLSVPKNKQEAMGLGITKGATGTSGVSCAHSFEQACGYTFPSFPSENQDSGRLYIIDTTKLDEGDEPYYMTDNVIKNGYNEKDTTGGEVNITRIPSKAIIGWIKFDYYTPNDMNPGQPEEQKETFYNWLDPDHPRNELIHVEFNSRYKP